MPRLFSAMGLLSFIEPQNVSVYPQPQTGACFLFGAAERIKTARLQLLRNPHAVINNSNDDTFPTGLLAPPNKS